MSTGPVVVVNAGSSSLKFALFEAGRVAARGGVEPLAQPSGPAPARARIRAGGGETLLDAELASMGHEEALDWLVEWLAGFLSGRSPAAFVHRVVHGGDEFTAPVRVDHAVLERLERLAPLAPLHQPHNLAPIRRLLARDDGIPQVASFDTAFHAGQDRLERAFPLPAAFLQRGLRRYGFHGHSYQSIAEQLPEVDPVAAAGRTAVFHLGNGASACALRGGRSVATTMGFSTLDGLMMGTRSGALDPGLVLHLLQREGRSAREVSELLYKQSGLLGVSGESADMRELLASPNPGAAFAVRLFCHLAAKQLAALLVPLEGLDAVVFTGGIGENAPPVRAEIVRRLAWLGVALDPDSNARGETRIHAEASLVRVLVLPTDEEAVLARAAAPWID